MFQDNKRIHDAQRTRKKQTYRTLPSDNKRLHGAQRTRNKQTYRALVGYTIVREHGRAEEQVIHGRSEVETTFTLKSVNRTTSRTRGVQQDRCLAALAGLDHGQKMASCALRYPAKNCNKRTKRTSCNRGLRSLPYTK